MHASKHSYDILTQADLQAMAATTSGRGPVFSLYLTLDSNYTPLERFENLLREESQRQKLDQSDQATREQWAREVERIRDWLQNQAPINLAAPTELGGRPVREERTVTDDAPSRDDLDTLKYLASRGELPETDNINVRSERPLQGVDSALDKRAAQDDLASRGMPAFDHSSDQKEHADDLAEVDNLATTEEMVSPENWPVGGRGLAIFSASAAGLWRAFMLPAVAVDRLVISDRPFVRPLEMLQAEYPCTLALLVDPGAARLVHVYLGQAAELERLRTLPDADSDMDSSIAAYTRQAVAHASEVWAQQPCDHVMIAGSKDAREAVRAALPEEMLEQLVGEADLSPLVTLEAVRDRVLRMDEQREQEVESRHVQEFLSAIEQGGAAVAGLEQTLLAVRSKKVRLLLVESGFHQAGGACPNCGYLGEGQEGKCLVCEMALRPEPDLVEAAMQQVMENDGEIEVLRSPRARGALQVHGEIGALLFDTDHPPVRNRSNDRTLSKGGNLNQDALHDEAMDESFPASDPPSY